METIDKRKLKERLLLFKPKTNSMETTDKTKLIEVFKGSLWEAELVKSLLDANDVRSVLKDGLVVNVVLPASSVEVKVLVHEDHYEQAMTVVRDYEKKRYGD